MDDYAILDCISFLQTTREHPCFYKLKGLMDANEPLLLDYFHGYLWLNQPHQMKKYHII